MRTNKNTLLIIIIILAAILVVTYNRSGNTFLKSLYVYLCGPYSYLSYLIDNSIISHLHLCGRNQIGFIYNFVYSALTALFGIEYNGTNYIISSLTSNMVDIGGGIVFNSLGTCLESFVCDFGILLSPIGVIIFAWVLNYMENKYCINKTSIHLAIYLIMVFATVNSIFSYSFGSPTFLITIIISILFARGEKRKLGANLLYENKETNKTYAII